MLSQVFAGATNTNAWGAATNGLQMSIRLDSDKNEIKAGQTFGLLISYRNLSTNETFMIYEVFGAVDDASYSFIAYSPSGKEILIKKPFEETLSGAVHGVEPGKTIEIRFNLSKLLTLDEIGTYRIIAKKGDIWLADKHKPFEVVSNTLNVKIVPNQ